MPRKTGDVNYTVGFKLSVLDEWRREGDTENPRSLRRFAADRDIQESTLRSWIRSLSSINSQSNQNQVASRALSNEQTQVIRWIRQLLEVEQIPVATSAVVDYMANNYPVMLTNKSYHAKRRIAERLVSQAWLEEFGYKPISENSGHGSSATTRSSKYNCKIGCGPQCKNRSRRIA